jgi:hypothetical protein
MAIPVTTMANTANITPRDGHEAVWVSLSSRIGTIIVPGMVALAAAGLLWLSVPRTVAAFVALPADRIADDLYQGRPAGPEEIDRLVATRERALAWADNPSHRVDLARAHIARGVAGTREGTGLDIISLDRAVATAGEAVTRSPVEPWPWIELAQALYMRSGGGAETAAVLSAAMVVGPDWPGAPFRNLDLGLALWTSLGPEDRSLLLRQARRSWARSRPLYVLRATTPVRAAILRAALADDPRALLDFERRLAQLRKER